MGSEHQEVQTTKLHFQLDGQGHVRRNHVSDLSAGEADSLWVNSLCPRNSPRSPPSPVLPLLWCVVKYSYPACFELCSRWKSTAVKGWDGFFFHGWLKEVVSWIFWVSCILISNIVWIFSTLAFCWLIFSHNNLDLHVCEHRMCQSNDETLHWVVPGFLFILQWMGDGILILVSFLLSLLMKWLLLFLAKCTETWWWKLQLKSYLVFSLFCERILGLPER